ncbi:unnamed protein product [Cuscuta campestris]|uniref:Nuclear pore complex protein NUP205 n=1 Tax=Cuscuta campestris TaxID=132261 RepID=A0A484LAR9_9ASTE|nr:unnamed protein product [Cuscuta campestris]
MVSPKQLLSLIESSLLGPTPPSPSQRVELLHAVRQSMPRLRSLVSYPAPNPSDRVQVQSKEVRLPDSGRISLDDQDVQIALKLSDDLHLNEIECTRLLISANQEWGLLGRDHLEIMRLAAGLWYTERRDLITALYMILRAVVLDQGHDANLVADLLRYMEDLMNGGVRQRLITLIKELNREEPAGLGGPNCELYVLDSRGALVERKAVVARERLILTHCLVLSVLIVRASPKDIKDIFSALKDSGVELNCNTDTIKHQIAHGLLFSVVVSLVSDALSAVLDKASILTRDVSFRHEFQETIMVSVEDPVVKGYVNCVRHAWLVHLMLIHDGVDAQDTGPSVSSHDIRTINTLLEVIFSDNVFEFWMTNILQTPAFENDDEDMVYMYHAYLHKMMSCFLSHPLGRDKVKEAKDKAMIELSPYRMTSSHDQDRSMHTQKINPAPQTFVSLLEFVSEIYQREPDLLSGNDVLWTFVNFAGEDHTNFHTLVAFLKMMSTLASTAEGSSKVFELLQGKTFRSIGWGTLFSCLSIYEEKFKQAIQSPGAMLPDIQEGDAKALVAYLNVLQKVVENANPIERKNWFTDIEPLFKLLGYENVPPYLKGALRNTITTFVKVSPVMKDTVWRYLEQYDLPVVVGHHAGTTGQPMATQVYDMQFELNEIEARREQYPSTISFINLLNTLIAEEKDLTDRGRRFIGIFKFIYEQVFGPFPQRAYADPSEKWQLVIACLNHFKMMLSMYGFKDEDIENIADQSQLSESGQSAPVQMQLPVVELMKDFMSGKSAFRNVMSILLPGVSIVINERTSQGHGHLLEKAILLSLEIIILVLEKDLIVSDFWRPVYQPLDVILSQDHNQVLALLEYIRYDMQPRIQQCSIKIMSVLSSRMVGLVQLLLKSNVAGCLVEDYASCLELCSEECQSIEDMSEDPCILILQLLIDNISRPAPNITHLLLKFDLDNPIERTELQPKFHYSCLKVILDQLEKLLKPDANALLHEFGFQLLYELSVDPLTCGPILDLLSTKRYQFFIKHLDIIGVAPLPKRNSSQSLRISSLHQVCLGKLMFYFLSNSSSTHRETCQSIIVKLFGQGISDDSITPDNPDIAGARMISKNKVLELLDVVQFKTPETSLKSSQIVSSIKNGFLAEDILSNPSTTEKGGLYYYSERGDRLIDLTAFRDKLWELSSFGTEVELNEIRETIQQLLRWGWKYNKNLEEQAAQLHMLTGWSLVVEICASRRLSSLQSQTEVLFQLLDASLGASGSPDCSLKMALILTQVGLTCMAKLRDMCFLCPGGLQSETITYLDIIMAKQLSNGACLSILYKMIMAILRQDSSEALRRRQYTLLLSYFQYCQHILDPSIPASVMQFFPMDEQDNEDADLDKIVKDHAELSHANFSILRKEAQAILDLVIKDATHGSELAKTISFYVLDALISFDHEKFFLNQLQSRGFLKSCLISITNFSYQDGFPVGSMQRVCTLEAELALLLRISYKYRKSGAQVLFSMDALDRISSCRALKMQIKGSHRRFEAKFGRELSVDVDKQRMVIAPVLRLVFSLTSLVDASEFFEVSNKVVREVIEFIRGHALLFDQILREDLSGADELTMEQINLVVSILTKIWPYDESDDLGIVQGLFTMMRVVFSIDPESFTSNKSIRFVENQRKAEVNTSRLCFSLSSYLYFLVTKKRLRLQVSDGSMDYRSSAGQQQPTLTSLAFLLYSLTTSLEKAAEERYLLLNKIQDINELSSQEVDEIINMCAHEGSISSSESIQRRRYLAIMEMCRIVGDRNLLITTLLLVSENVMNIILFHFQDSSYECDPTKSVKRLTYDSKPDTNDDLSMLCGKLISTVERLGSLSEDKIGHELKVFHRLSSSLKELSIQKLGL